MFETYFNHVVEVDEQLAYMSVDVGCRNVASRRLVKICIQGDRGHLIARVDTHYQLTDYLMVSHAYTTDNI